MSISSYKFHKMYIIQLGILCIQYGVFPCQSFSDMYITLHADVDIASCVTVFDEECLLGSGQYESTC
jgi:hypothetical protein